MSFVAEEGKSEKAEQPGVVEELVAFIHFRVNPELVIAMSSSCSRSLSG